jgi:hypothetical protein
METARYYSKTLKVLAEIEESNVKAAIGSIRGIGQSGRCR